MDLQFDTVTETVWYQFIISVISREMFFFKNTFEHMDIVDIVQLMNLCLVFQ